MKLVSKHVETITTERYQVQLTAGNIVTVTDYLDERGKVIDTVFRDEDGFDIDDPALFEYVIEFIDKGSWR
jgi:uncharacterized protein (DUF2141 family)